jgi:hypothetical protein
MPMAARGRGGGQELKGYNQAHFNRAQRIKFLNKYAPTGRVLAVPATGMYARK